MRTVVAIAAVVWGACGAIAFLTLEDALRAGTLGDAVLIWPAIAIYKIGVHGVLTDDAHGPPFPAVGGILVFYFVPVLVAVAWLVWSRRQR